MYTATELKALAQQEMNARMRMRILAIYHFKLGKNRTQISALLGVARGSVNKWVNAYLAQGIEGLKTKRNSGRPAKLSPQEQQQVSDFVTTNSIKEDGGRLIAEDVQTFIANTFNVNYSLRNVYYLLHNAGFSWITSRSKHPKQSQEAQETFKKLQAVNDPSHPI